MNTKIVIGTILILIIIVIFGSFYFLQKSTKVTTTTTTSTSTTTAVSAQPEIFPGTLNSAACPVFIVPMYGSITNASGFGIYNISNAFNNTSTDYVLAPGNEGTITYEIYRGSPISGFNQTLVNISAEENLTNDAELYHGENFTVEQNVTSANITLSNGTVVPGYGACYVFPGQGIPASQTNSCVIVPGTVPVPPANGANVNSGNGNPGACYAITNGIQNTSLSTGCSYGIGPLPPTTFNYTEEVYTHPGISVSFQPQSEMLGFNSSASVTAFVSASSDAPEGTYWLSFNGGPCGGGPIILLTIGNAPYTGGFTPFQPP